MTAQQRKAARQFAAVLDTLAGQVENGELSPKQIADRLRTYRDAFTEKAK